jgi:hypothetical protein
MDANVALALISAGSTVVGVAAGGGISYALEGRRERHVDRVRADEAALELRRAIRLVLEELTADARAIDEAARAQSLLPLELSSSAWARYEPVIAAPCQRARQHDEPPAHRQGRHALEGHGGQSPRLVADPKL